MSTVLAAIQAMLWAPLEQCTRSLIKSPPPPTI